MYRSSTACETQSASRYLQQVCKHFAHKVDVEFDQTKGVCRFSCGTADLEAENGALTIHVSATHAEGLAETQQVVESHLLRFAFREELGPLVWTDVE